MKKKCPYRTASEQELNVEAAKRKKGIKGNMRYERVEHAADVGPSIPELTGNISVTFSISACFRQVG